MGFHDPSHSGQRVACVNRDWRAEGCNLGGSIDSRVQPAGLRRRPRVLPSQRRMQRHAAGIAEHVRIDLRCDADRRNFTRPAVFRKTGKRSLSPCNPVIRILFSGSWCRPVCMMSG